MDLGEDSAKVPLRRSSGLISLLGLVAGGGLGLSEVGGGLGFLVAGGGSVVGVGACCAKEVPNTPIAGNDASATSCGGWAPRGREGADVAGGSIGPGAGKPGGNSNGGSGGKVGALVGGGAAKRSPPPTTVPGTAEWVGISMSATAAAMPAATMTMMISLTLRILTSGRLTLASRCGSTMRSIELHAYRSSPAAGYLNRSTGSSCICSTPGLGCFAAVRAIRPSALRRLARAPSAGVVTGQDRPEAASRAAAPPGPPRRAPVGVPREDLWHRSPTRRRRRFQAQAVPSVTTC